MMTAVVVDAHRYLHFILAPLCRLSDLQVSGRSGEVHLRVVILS
jgi:hypothetical protein